MLRKSAARAFGPGEVRGSEVERTPIPPAPEESRRGEALARLFRDLHETLAACVVPAEGGGDAFRVSAPRVLPGGHEFTLEGPGGTLFFRDSLAGFIEVERRIGAARTLEIISVHLQGGAYRPIHKTLPAPTTGGGWGARRRAPFRFTSIPELARECLAAWRRGQGEL